MKLTNRLVAFVTMIVICAIFVIFIGGVLSFHKLGTDYLDHYLDGVVNVIDQEIAEPEGQALLSRWLPKLLKSSNVVEFEIKNSAGVVYEFKGQQRVLDPQLLHERHYSLRLKPDYVVNIKSVPPYTNFSYSIGAMSSISLAIGIVIIGLICGLHWLRKQLYGSQLLEERGRMILSGKVEQYALGKDQEWPGSASLALDQLISELKDARQERSRFDTFIRTHTFLDQLTGAANRVLFDSRLQSMVQDKDNHGVVLLLRLTDWDEFCIEKGKDAADDLVQEVSVILSNFIQRFPDSVLARYFDSEFAVLIPQQSAKDVKLFTHQLLKVVERISPPAPMQKDNWCHIGITFFYGGESRGRIIDEVYMALRSAQLQGTNSWNIFNKDRQWEESRGSVRWRTLLDRNFTQGGLVLYQQPIVMVENNLVMCRELMARIKDENGRLMKASNFIPAVKQVGYCIRMDKLVIRQTLEILKNKSAEDMYSVNIFVVSLLDKAFVKWLRDELLQTPRTVLNRLVFEVVESRLVKHLDQIRPILKIITAVGCKLVVDQAGRTIVSTHYIKVVNACYIKLHRGLVRDINQRQENQLFVRSMLGACADTNVKVIAAGVENEKEWLVLKQLGVIAGQGRFFESEKLVDNKIDKK